MLKKMGGYVALLLLATGLLWKMGLNDIKVLWQNSDPIESSQKQAETSKQETEKSELEDKNQPLQADDGALSLLLEKIDLLQGEGGFDLWRLQAHWANIRQEDGIIFLDQPQLKYFTEKNDKKFLLVTSKKGEVDQLHEIIRFLGDVESLYETSTVKGKILVYDGKKREMWYPEGGAFQGQGIAGQAQSLKWLLDSRIIEAEGNVQVLFMRHTPNSL